MTEMGPYRTIDGGQSITNNPTSWNQYAHMIFLDAPAGVGYSINRNNHYNFTDTEVWFNFSQIYSNFRRQMTM